MTITAPSVAPDDTPSVSGDASGLRSRAWNTTPATAKLPPTSAAASTRGSRATKNTCASTLSANGIVRLNTRDSEIGVLPTIGATRPHTTVSAPNAATVTTSRRRTSVGAGKRHHREVTGARMPHDVCVHAVQRPNAFGVQDALGRAVREHAPRPQQHELRAERRRQIQIVRRPDTRHPALAAATS